MFKLDCSLIGNGGILIPLSKESLNNLLKETLRLLLVLLLLAAIIAVNWKVYDEQTAIQSTWLLVKIIGGLLTWLGVIKLLQALADEATDAKFGVKSTANVIGFAAAALSIVVVAAPFVYDNLILLSQIDNMKLLLLDFATIGAEGFIILGAIRMRKS